MDNINDIVNVMENSEDATALKETAEEVVELIRSKNKNIRRLVEAWSLAYSTTSCNETEGWMFGGLMRVLEGLIGGLIRVMGKDGDLFREAREAAVYAIWGLVSEGSDEVRKGLFEYDGLVDCLLGRMRKGGVREREDAVGVIRHIADGDMMVKRGLFEHEGLIDGLIEIAGQTGNEYGYARQVAVLAMNNVADGDDVVKVGLFHLPGLMVRIEAIIGDATIDDTMTKILAEEVKEKVKQPDNTGGGQSNPTTNAQCISSDTDTLVRVEREQAMRSLQIAMRTEQAAMRTKLLQEISSVRSEQAAMSAELSSVRSEQAIVRSELSSVRESLSQMTNVLNSVAASVLSLVVSNGHTRALPHTAAALPKRSHSEDDNPRSDVLVKTEQFDEQLDEHLYKRVKSESSSPFTPPPSPPPPPDCRKDRQERGYVYYRRTSYYRRMPLRALRSRI